MSVTTGYDWKVDIPEGKSGQVSVQRFEIPEESWEAMRMAISGRGTQPGWYTGLYRNGMLWMSDTQAEWWDNSDAVWRAQREGGRILTNGLGLGMFVKAVLESDRVEQVDVVEIDEDVIRLVGPTYERDDRVKIYHADALTMKWPAGSSWTVAWHDIWPHMSEDLLPEYARLKRMYGRRVGWQECWGESLVRRQMRRTAREWDW